MQQKDLDQLKDNLQTLLDKKFQRKKYIATVAFVDDYKKDKTDGTVSMKTHFIRISNTDAESPYIIIKSILNALKVAVEQIEGKRE